MRVRVSERPKGDATELPVVVIACAPTKLIEDDLHELSAAAECVDFQSIAIAPPLCVSTSSTKIAEDPTGTLKAAGWDTAVAPATLQFCDLAKFV
jgi:hypothetical protein